MTWRWGHVLWGGIKHGKRLREGWRGCCFYVYQVFGEVLCNRITFKKRPEEKQWNKHLAIWGKSIPSKGNSRKQKLWGRGLLVLSEEQQGGQDVWSRVAKGGVTVTEIRDVGQMAKCSTGHCNDFDLCSEQNGKPLRVFIHGDVAEYFQGWSVPAVLSVNIQWEQKQENLLEWPIVTIIYDNYLDIYSIQVQDDYGLRQIDSIRNCQNT